MQHANPESSTTEKEASREEEATTTEKEERTEAMETEVTVIAEIEEEAEATVTVGIVEAAATDLVEETTRRETAVAAEAEATRRGTIREEDPEALTPAEADDLLNFIIHIPLLSPCLLCERKVIELSFSISCNKVRNYIIIPLQIKNNQCMESSYLVI